MRLDSKPRPLVSPFNSELKVRHFDVIVSSPLPIRSLPSSFHYSFRAAILVYFLLISTRIMIVPDLNRSSHMTRFSPTLSLATTSLYTSLSNAPRRICARVQYVHVPWIYSYHLIQSIPRRTSYTGHRIIPNGRFKQHSSSHWHRS